MISQAKQSIQVAIITGAHGIRGEVKLRALVEHIDSIFSASLSDKSGKRQFKLTRRGGTDDNMIAAIDGITDRNQAELLKNVTLYGDAASLPEDERVRHEIVGAEARLENGSVYGKVIAVHNYGAGDILEIELQNGDSEMLPFSDAFVPTLKIEEGYVVVIPPEYLEVEKQ